MLLSLAASVTYFNKSYRSYNVLVSARTLDIPKAGNIRAWMTLDYIASSYGIAVADLGHRLGLAPETEPGTTLRSLSKTIDIDPLAYVLQVQKALAALNIAEATPLLETEPDGWIHQLTEDIYSALLAYGYPVLGLVLFLGALGLPVPAGPLTAVAGTLALQGEVDWAVACSLAVIVSVLGDMTGYGAGRLLNQGFLDRWGHWIGYTKANRKRLQRLFENWGALTLILTRSLVAHIGAVASILAGAGRYRMDRFLVFSVIGRSLWTASYFGLGFAVGSDFEVASGFLGYLSLFLITITITIGCGVMLTRLRHTPQHN
ncbi:MAG: DedA family protein [Alphaproteobacteria bacterium]